MKQLMIVMGLFLAAACGGGSGVEGEMTGWKDKMCKCTDKACAEKTMEEYNAWAKGKRESAKDMPKDQLEKIMGIEKELKACRRKLRDDGAGGGDKPAEGGDKPADKPAEGAAPADKPADKPADGAAK